MSTGPVCHINDSCAAGNILRSSRRLEFLAVLVLLVLYVPIYYFTNSRSFEDILAQPPPQGASITYEVEARRFLEALCTYHRKKALLRSISLMELKRGAFLKTFVP